MVVPRAEPEDKLVDSEAEVEAEVEAEAEAEAEVAREASHAAIFFSNLVLTERRMTRIAVTTSTRPLNGQPGLFA